MFDLGKHRGIRRTEYAGGSFRQNTLLKQRADRGRGARKQFADLVFRYLLCICNDAKHRLLNRRAFSDRNLLFHVDALSNRDGHNGFFPNALSAQLCRDHAGKRIDKQTMVCRMHPTRKPNLFFEQDRIGFDNPGNILNKRRIEIGCLFQGNHKAFLEPIPHAERNKHMMPDAHGQRFGDPVGEESVYRAMVDVDNDLCVHNERKKACYATATGISRTLPGMNHCPSSGAVTVISSL